MIFQETTDYGVISIDDALINQIIKDSLKPFEGSVWCFNYKGKQNDSFFKIRNFEGLNYFEYIDEENCKVLNIYLVAKFGESLSKISEVLINSVYKSLTDELEIPIDNIRVIFTGLISAKGIIKRETTFYLHEENN